MRPNELMVAGLIVPLVGLFIVVRHVMGIPSDRTPLLAGVGLLIAGAIRSMMCGKWKSC